MDNKFGKISTLNIKTKNKKGKAIIDDLYFTAPFKVMNPFYLDEESMKIIILSASAGIMAGDRQVFEINVGENTNLELVSQAFEKIHKMNEGEARRETNIEVEKNASLKYNTMPTIPFKCSAYSSLMKVNLHGKSSKFILNEILSCGRSACGEKFEYSYYNSLVSVYNDGKLIYRDNTKYNPSILEMNGIGIYEGYTHLSNLLICNDYKDDEWISKVRELLDETSNIYGGVTRIISGDIIIRIFGYQSQKLSDINEYILTV